MLNSRQPRWPRIAQEWVRQSLDRTESTLHRVAHRLDVAYGELPGQCMDIYWPEGLPSVNLPVVAFIHGGYFTNGSPRLAGHMADWVTRMPAVLVCIGYRLAPRASLAEQIADCAQAVAWVSRHICDVGGDGNRIALLGHSAGGLHAAMLALQAQHLERNGCSNEVIQACMPISGVYDLTQAVPRVSRYVIKQAGDDFRYSPLYQINDYCRIPFVLAVAEYDFGDLKRDRSAFANALRSMAVPVSSIDLFGVDHFSETLMLQQSSMFMMAMRNCVIA